MLKESCEEYEIRTKDVIVSIDLVERILEDLVREIINLNKKLVPIIEQDIFNEDTTLDNIGSEDEITDIANKLVNKLEIADKMANYSNLSERLGILIFKLNKKS